MKYKSIACPAPSKGLAITGKKLVVPNQAMTLQEILTRFTRNEPLPIGKDVTYHESEDDLEKVRHMDLVDRQEFVDKLKNVQKDYEKQEKEKAKRHARQAVDKAKAELKAELEKQQKPPVKEAPAE